jgi:hypothetical protein
MDVQTSRKNLKSLLQGSFYGKNAYRGEDDLVRFFYFYEFIKDVVEEHEDSIAVRLLTYKDIFNAIHQFCTSPPISDKLRILKQNTNLWLELTLSMRNFTYRVAFESISMLTSSMVRQVLVEAIPVGKLTVRKLESKLLLAVEVSKIVSSIFNTDKIRKDELPAHFMAKLGSNIRNKLLQERIRDQVRETDPGVMKYLLEKAIIIEQAQDTAKTQRDRNLKLLNSLATEYDPELASDASDDHEATSVEEIEQEAFDDYELGDGMMYALAQTALKRTRRRVDKKREAKAKVNAIANQNNTRPSFKSDKARAHPSTDIDPKLKQERLDQGKCILCGAPGPDQGGHWATHCPHRTKFNGRQLRAITVDSMRQFASLHPHLSNDLCTVIESIDTIDKQDQENV